MKLRHLFTVLTVLAFASCESYDDGASVQVEDSSAKATVGDVQQITDDVTSIEVNNIIASVLKKKKGRSEDGYTISLLKDSVGKDCMICVNYDNDGGFVLISAEKTYTPILAYAEEGNFSLDGDLPPALQDWTNYTMHDISESEFLPADSLASIACQWRKYEYTTSPTVDNYPDDHDHGNLKNISWEEYLECSRIMMDKMNEWNAKGYRYYEIDNYTGTTSIGDKDAIATYVQGRIHPQYMEDYWALTFVVEREVQRYSYGKGSVIKTNWCQDQGFNNNSNFYYLCLKTGRIEQYPAGCGPVAFGQIMYYYRYPDSYNWDAMPLNPPGNKDATDLLYDIKTRMGAQFDTTEVKTSVTREGLYKGITSYGYSCDTMSAKSLTAAQLVEKSPLIILSQLIKNGRPQGGHAWILDGGAGDKTDYYTEIWSFDYDKNFVNMHTDESSVTIRYFYVNWGWGKNNGYYTNLVPDKDGYTGNSLQTACINIKPINQ